MLILYKTYSSGLNVQKTDEMRPFC